jgi:molybdate transport system substrate-binding protein
MRRPAAALALLLALVSAGCGNDEGSRSKTLTVFAAASLTNTFTELGKEFEADHDGVTVRFSFGGSSDLVEQIQSGAPADVFASADTKNMDKLGDAATDPHDFASNTLEIAVPPGNPAGITSLRDLAKPSLKLVICAPEVPCGTATQAVAQAVGLTLTPVSQEQSVTDVLGKVATGEADAGVVYVTDVKGAGDKVDGITFPESAAAVNVYPISVVEDADNGGAAEFVLAHEFVEFIRSDQGQQVLADAGFAKPQ